MNSARNRKRPNTNNNVNTNPFIGLKRRNRIVFWMGFVDYACAAMNLDAYERRGYWINILGLAVSLCSMAYCWQTWDDLRQRLKKCLATFHELRRRRIKLCDYHRSMGLELPPKMKFDRRKI